MVMEAVAQSWATQREQIRDAAARIRGRLAAVGGARARATSCRVRTSLEAAHGAAARGRGQAQRRLRRRAEVPAGLGGRAAAGARGARGRRAAPSTRWPAGGINDQLGGGFARYSVDARWLVPHFEKMLYDNALLARAYLHGLPGARPRALADRLRAHARLDADRDAWAGGRLLLRARRRLRGRGGPLLRLDPGRDPRGARTRRPRRARGRRDRLLGRHRGRQLRGQQHPPPPRRRRGRDAAAGSTRRAGRCTRRAPTRVWPGSTTSGSAPGTRS